MLSPSISQPISAAKTVEVSRSTAAWPTEPSRVASMMPPKEAKADDPADDAAPHQAASSPAAGGTSAARSRPA
jgi:hypothetical protein